MTDQELIAKTVFGEITLEEVLNKFADRISSIEVDQGFLDDGILYSEANKYESWLLEDGELQLFGKYGTELALPLDSKVKVQEHDIEIRNEDGIYSLTFIEFRSIKFDSLLPGGMK